MNLFGFDTSGLSIAAFVTSAHAFWGALSAVTIALLLAWGRRTDRSRPWRLVVLLAVAGHALAWLITVFPLPNIYGVNGSMDRDNHLGWVEVILAGNPPLHSSQVHQLNFEPFWPNLVALATLHRPEAVGFFFQVSPLIVGLLFVFSVFAAFRRGLSTSESIDQSRMEAAFAAFFAILLAAAYNDQTSPFRNPWAMMFMLKPNHALGLVLTPWVLLALARARTWKDRLWAGFLLQLLGWVFVIHMVFVISGFMLFVALSWLRKQPGRTRDLFDTVFIVLIGLILVSPYTVFLTDAVGSTERAARLGIQPGSAHTFDATLRLGPIFLLSLWGARSLLRGSSRFGQVLAAQYGAAQINWQIYHLLGMVQLGREMDEAQYWARFLTALVGGVGVWRLGLRVLAGWRRRPAIFARLRWHSVEPVVAGLILALAAPAAIPSWWDPARMDLYFAASLKPQPERVVTPTRFLRHTTDGTAVVAGDRVYARYTAAYGARRVLLTTSLNPPRDLDRRVAVEAAILRGKPQSAIEDGWRHYGVRYLLITPQLLTNYPEVTIPLLLARPDLRLVFEFRDGEDYVLVLELVEAR